MILKTRTHLLLQLYPVLLLAGCLAALPSCGKKGDPSLPRQAAPESVSSFRAAARPGTAVLLWKFPKKNTDDSPLLDLDGCMIFRESVSFENICLRCPVNFMPLHDYDYVGPRGQIPEGSRQVYYDTTLKPDHLYTYKIACYNTSGAYGPATSSIRLYYAPPPEPPRAVRAERRHRLVLLRWQQPKRYQDGETISGDDSIGFTVYRDTAPDMPDSFPLNKALLPETVFEDIPPRQDTTYYYEVRAVRSFQGTRIESQPSRRIGVSYMDITPPGTPRGLTAIPAEKGIMLKWMPKGEKDFAGFNIYRKKPWDDQFTRLNTAPVTLNTWTDKTAKKGRRYTYGITAVDRAQEPNESPLSKTVTVFYITK
jgi:hypothetical protein